MTLKPVALIGLLALAACAAPPAADQDEPEPEFSFNIPLWPVFEDGRLATGEHRTWVLGLFHVTTRPDGENHSWHLLNYFSGPDYRVLFPIYYSVGEEGEERRGVPPVWFGWPDGWIAPPLLSGAWKHGDGGRTTWLTPLFHLTEDAAGEIESLHAGLYFQGRESSTLFPVYSTWNDGWMVPLALTGRHGYADGSRVTWVTPLFHLAEDKDGNATSFHLGPYFEGEGWSVLFPLYVAGRDSFVAPLALSGRWKNWDGSRTTWVTPLFHLTESREGEVESFHVGPYFEGDDYSVLFPLYFSAEDHFGVLPPLAFFGPDYACFPPLLSGGMTFGDGTRTTWVTPLFHLTQDPEGFVQSLHVGPFYQEGEHTGLLPLVLLGPGYAVVPPLLSGAWTYDDGSRASWLTPLLHLSQNAEGGAEYVHAAPFFFWNRDDYWVAPPALTGRFHFDDGSRSTWVTPLFHLTEDADRTARSLHAAPFYFWERDRYWAVPPLLAGGVTHADGAESTWVTPLFHVTSDRDGNLESLHAGPYFEGPDHRVLFPLYGEWTRADGGTSAMAPLLFYYESDPDGTVEASLFWPLMTYRRGKELDTSWQMELRPFVYQSADDGYEFNFLWRLLSLRREGEASREMVGPFWWSSTPGGDVPSEFRILGGLVARDCDYEKGAYRYRLLWIIPTGITRFDVGEELGLKPIY